MFSLWVMAKSGAARYFESVFIRSPPFIAFCLSAGHGVPLHTLYPSDSQRGSIWRMTIRLSRNTGKPIKKPPHFSKGKSEGAAHPKKSIFYNFFEFRKDSNLSLVYCVMVYAFFFRKFPLGKTFKKHCLYQCLFAFRQ